MQRNLATSIIIILTLKFGLSRGCPDGCHCNGNIVSCRASRLQSVPSGISNTTERLYLQHNSIKRVMRKDLAGLAQLRKLHLNSNQIRCIQDGAFQSLVNLEILLLNDNNLSVVPSTVFGERPINLRIINLNSNPLNCNCQHVWLLEWMQQRSSLTVSSSCFIPQNVESVSTSRRLHLECEDMPLDPVTGCQTMNCPEHCTCSLDMVDCRNRDLVLLPDVYPLNVTELHLEQNLIRIVTSTAFSIHRDLRRIDLSNNLIEEIKPGAFEGLRYLTSLVLYGNEITVLPPGVFQGLTNLQMLLLNANKIKCLRQDVFQGLTALNLLSLYDNSLQHLAKGTFESLQAIETLHLARNPFICDCKLRWLTKYLKKNPVETSGAKCAGPTKLAKKKISLIKGRRFRCLSGIVKRVPNRKMEAENTECLPDIECPKRCICDTTAVNCSSQNIQEIPDNIPPYASIINLCKNNIGFISNNGGFKKLKNANSLDISQNHIVGIDEGAFTGLVNLIKLDLNDNKITVIRKSSFIGLNSLQILILRNNKISCVHNDSFIGLSSLQHLSLYGNQITTVMMGSLSSLISLQTLNLLTNPLNCNCHMDWFGAWLRESMVATGNLRCSSPTFLAGLPISDINSRDFQCSIQEKNNSACNNVVICPSGCLCQEHGIYCGHAALIVIPVGEMFHEITELYLEHNKIRLVPLEINELVLLTTLDLSNNQLTYINDNQFSGLNQLRTLLLAYNNIQCISKNSFIGLVSLRSLSLHSNNLSSLPERIFHALPLLTNVGLAANPWYCNCHLRWLAVSFDPIGIARCSGPQRMEGRLIAATPAAMFVCQGTSDIQIVAKCNPCMSSPCQQNSTCMLDIMEQYSCQCPAGFQGRHCEVVNETCSSLVCLNGGTCMLTNSSNMCICPDGFQGDHCETNVNGCKQKPCQARNATCIDQANSFTCKCPMGWQGPNCEKPISNPCMPRNPCLNEAECIVEEGTNNSYRCLCTAGFHGKNCSINPCYHNNCQNGGVCVISNQSSAGYQCHCNNMFRGENCDTPAIDVLVQDDPCANHYCLNGGECYRKQEAGEYGCWCPPGYGGNTCEKLFSINFQENGSYVDLHMMYEHDMNLTFFLSTIELFGIIFYKGHHQNTKHVAVEIYSGHIRLSIDQGNFPGSTLYSTVPINDGKLHKVQVIVHHGSASLKLDNLYTARVNVGTIVRTVNENLASLFLGGVSKEMLTYAKKMIHIRNSTSFQGCINAFYFNGTKVNFNQLRSSLHHVTPGCTSYLNNSVCSASRCGNHGSCEFKRDYGIHCVCFDGYAGENCKKRSGNVCDRHLCQHGTCIEQKQKYKCKCLPGFTGQFCQNHICTQAACHHGTCIPLETGYKCKCQRHFTGRHCEDRIRKCKGTRIKQFFEIQQRIQVTPSTLHNAANTTRMCRSKRRYTNILCNSDCLSTERSNRKMRFLKSEMLCCQPLRIQPKRVRMKCDDGSNIFEVVQKVRRCACKRCNDMIVV